VNKAVAQPDLAAAPAEVLSRPELLAPAGDWECAKAAVENGADAIYFGLDRFNARMRAHNFTEADLPKLMEFLHLRGVKGYVTFNTLVFANELAQAEQYLRTIIAAGVDAAIVQDVGIARLIRELSPDFPIHASTQMTITSAAGVEFARELGCNLVVLARECSIKDIEAIRKEVISESVISNQSERSAADSLITHPLPLEVFVHGALCVAYSGQCLTSESLGGRSANRGECAQACRMPYQLVSDGKDVPLGDRKYLLSPQDLAGVSVLPDLVRAGVASLKIEGRLKTPEYVANVTRAYREAIDRAITDPRVCLSTLDSRRYELEMAFSRGLYAGWLGGINNQELVHAHFGKKRGVFLGTVTRVERERVVLRLEAPLKAGDGIVFDAGRPEEQEEGGRVFAVERAPGILPGRGSSRNEADSVSSKASARHDAESTLVALTFGRGAVNFARVKPGNKVWKTSDPELDRELRQTFASDKPRFQRPISIDAHGHAGAQLTLVARDELGHVAQAASSMPLGVAEQQPLTTERLREQLGRLGGTPFQLGALENSIEGEVIVPVSELNRLRRELVAELERQRREPKRWGLKNSEFRVSSIALKAARRESSKLETQNPELIVLVRSLPQLEAALRCGVQTFYCEFEDPKKYREAVSTVRCASGCKSSSQEVWVVPPRITKPGEEWILKQVRSCDADGYLIRNYDHLKFFGDCRRRGDFSLNVANPLTAEYFLEHYRLEHVTASYDLNFDQLSALLRSAPPDWFEITIHQHMPMFHMEHCVFCAFLSSGKDFRDCGRPCDKHEVKLRDRVGMEHPLKADAGCRNTLFNALAQTGAEYVSRMIELGARKFRLEFLNEPPDQVTRTIAMYRQLLRGDISGTQLWRELKLSNQLGVTRGQMEKR
jgi:U32 family peptidase